MAFDRSSRTGGRRPPARRSRRRTADLTSPQIKASDWRPQGARGIAMVAGGALITIAALVFYALTPNPLPLSSRTVTANGVAGQDLYVGMFAPGGDFKRTIRVSGVKVHATSSAPIKVTPLLCRRGTVGVTTEPEKFCADVLDPEGQRLVTGDSIVLRIRADEPTIAVIDRIRLGYREDLRAATLAAGYAKAVVTLAGGQGD